MKKLLKKTTAGLLLILSISALLCVPAFAASDYSYFDDAVFLGDSLTVGLEKYVSSQKKAGNGILGEAQFLATNGYMLSQCSNADGFSKHPEYNGSRLQPQKSIAAMEAKKVFITMGINDSAGEVSTLVKNYAKLIDAIRYAAPEAELFMIAVFPMTNTKENSLRNNDKINAINASLMKLAIETNICFIDFTGLLKNGSSLNKAYSSDDYVHFSNEGYEVWVSQMRAFAKFAQHSSSSSSGVQVINVKQFVNGRSGPSSSSKRIAKVPKGANVDVLEKSEGSWYRVMYDSEEMYISGKYLSISAASSELSGRVVNVSEFANLRKLPSSDAEMLGAADKDSVLAISRKYYNPEWYRSYLDGGTCYISNSYLKLD